jgi:prepilin-type N-terminal cleavage/methylation domain-containing protein
MMKNQQAFTLIELAVVLTIIALLVGSFLIPLGTQIDVAKIRSTEKTLEQVKQALIHYAATNNRLPCPATDVESGLELNTLTNCQKEGYFPWANLGMGQYDAWGNPLNYRVDQIYSQEIITETMTQLPGTFSNIEVRDIQDSMVADSDIVAIIYSRGKDGKSYQPISQFPILLSSHSPFQNEFFLKTLSHLSEMIITPAFAEAQNRPGSQNDNIYYQDSLIPNKYDDVLIFLSKNHLVALSERVQSTTVAINTPVLDDNLYTPVLDTPVQEPTDSQPTENTGSSNTGSTDSGSTDTGSSDTGSTDSGSTDSGSTDSGSTDTGSTDSGSTDTGSTDSGSTDTGSTDSGSTDTGSTDTGSTDSGSTDTGSTDSGSTDTGSTDTGSTDTGSTDTGSTDTGSTDSGSTDTGSTDSGSTDTGSTDTGSTDSGSTDTGSTDTGSTDTGSTDSGSTDTGSTDTGSTDSGSTDSGSTDSGTTDTSDSGTGNSRTGDGFNQGDFVFGNPFNGGLLQQFDSQP